MNSQVAEMPDEVAAGQRGQAGRWARILGLSAGLLVLQGLLGGFYYETNDDLLMELLLRGITAAAPVSDLHLYLHGWSQLLVHLYGAAPTVPWYGLLLYSTLYVALVVSFWTLETISNGRLRGRWLLAAEVVFYLLTYFLHALQVNFTRPALLLGAAAALVLLVPRPARRQPGASTWLIAGLILAAGWGLRPSGATLGLALVLPLALWHGWNQGLRKALFLVGLVGALTGLRMYTDTAVDREYRRNDLDRSRLFDFGVSTLKVHTPLDSLAYKTLMPYQGMNDSVLLNPAFFRRAMQPATSQHFNLTSYRAAFVVAAGSLGLRLLGCLLLVALGALAVWRGMQTERLRVRSWPVLAYLAYQALFVGVFLVLVPHMPLRVLQPLVTIYLLTNAVLVLGCLLPATPLSSLLPGRAGRWAVGAGLLVGLLWLVVNGRLWQQLRTDNQAHDAYLARLEAEAGPGVLVEQGLYAAYPHLAPLAEHHLQHYQKVVMLTGWPAFDPSQPRLRQALTGTRDLPTALEQLSQRPTTAWVMQPAFATMLAHYLNARLALPVGQQIHFEPVATSQLPTPAANPPRLFRLRRDNAAPETPPGR